MITEEHACLARDNRLEQAVTLSNLAGKYAKERPIQPRERRVIETTLNDGSDVGEETIPVSWAR